MALPAASLQVTQAKTPRYADILQQRDEFAARENALAEKRLKQQQNAMLNQAYADAYDPQTGTVNTSKLYGSLAKGGIGSEIPGQMEAFGKGQEAAGKGSKAQLDYARALVNDMHTALGGSRSREEALANGAALAQKYPELAQQLKQELASVPADPAGFAQWHEQQLRATLDAKDQLEQQYFSQNLGGRVRIVGKSKYSTDGMTVVPGSEAEVTMSPAQMNPAGRVIQDAEGNYVLVNPRTGGASPVTMGGGTAALATNPGALKDGAFARSQPGYAGARGGFAVFETPEAGIAAQERLLSSAYINKGRNTISKIVDRYAPVGGENSPEQVNNYKSYIAQRTGLDINAPISPAQVPAVAAAMREFETGQRPNAAAPGQVRGAQPAAVKEQVKVQRGRDNVSNTVATMRDLYSELLDRGGAVESGGGVAALPGNIANYLAGTSVGKPIGRALGTQTQATRDKIINLRRMLVTQIADAAGLSAQEMNSNVELQGLLDAATDPTQSIETVQETLNQIEKLYGRPNAKPQTIGRKKKAAAPRKTPTSGGWGKAEVVGD